jgi:hypothetical protein
MSGWARSALLLLLVAILVPRTSGAEALSRDRVPQPLVPWVDWALHDAGDAVCPSSYGDPQRRLCAWPARLSLELTDRGGRFEQRWQVYRRSFVALPGDARIWPQDVTVNGAPAIVVARKGAPVVELQPGRHSIAGAFALSELPESIPIPRETGLVSLVRLGKPVRFPDRDLAGLLWLRRQREEQEGGSRLDAIVHRRVVDEVPLLLETLIELRVSGPAREVLLGPVLLQDFVAMSLEAAVPTRLEPDGRLRAQVRPGTWSLRLVARHSGGPVSQIALPVAKTLGDVAWESDEVWVFDARNQLRVVDVEEVPGVDPQQTRLPEAWKHLPAYLMQPGARMRFNQRTRGAEDPPPDQLTLTRTWWLDFDGQGYTVHDALEGSLTQSWRLEVAEPMQLGRVAINGQDQFLSRLDADGRAGVEVRQGSVDLEADSRMEGVRGVFPAAGWRHDFQRLSGQLQLPPGWRLFHAAGVDDVQTTWIRQWSLLDIFLALVTAMIVAQLSGWIWAGVALAALILSYPEPGAPRYTWLVLLAAQALLRALPAGRLQQAVRLAQVGAIAALALVAIPFIVQQARVAFYPSLELPHLAVDADAAQIVRASPELQQAARPAAKRGLGESVVDRLEQMESEAVSELLVSERPASAKLDYYAPDPTASVSTGPGLPHWVWRTVQLGWRGPVQQAQQIRLWLIPPWANFLLAGLRIGLIGALAVCVLGLALRRRQQPPGVRSSVLAGLGLVLLAGISAPVGAADIPSPEMLDELRTRLLEPPACTPTCAASPRMRLEVSPAVLRARIEIDAAAAVAVPLPGGLRSWTPSSVALDGKPASELAHTADGRLWIGVPRGKHQVLIEGSLPERDVVELPLPLRPHRVVVERLAGWRLDGLTDAGEPQESLQLSRERSSDAGGLATLEPQDLPPFVRVSRTLRLGLEWQVETRVERATPPGRALFLEIPLLAGESVTSDAIEVNEGKALVRMGPGARSMAWTSVLEVTSRLALEAPDELAWTEVWRLDASPIWHVEVQGFPAVHEAQPQPIRVREWRPWPTEQLELVVSRPASIGGRTLTLDRVGLSTRPGLRSSEHTLELSLRSSRGAQHTIVLPEGSELQSTKIDGVLQPMRDIDGRLVLPVRPGSHLLEIVWQASVPIALRYATPPLDPGGPSVNSELELAVPRDRWVLYVGGPRLGPAVLFWSALVIAVLLSLGLGRVSLTPLRTGSWFLLLVGMTQVPIWASLLVVGWLLGLGWRRVHGARASSAGAFDGLQVLLSLWTLLALGILVWAVQQGLLGLPDMQIRGNGSSGRLLRWYHDRSTGALPSAWMVSVPLGAYRLAMLAWALWLARALVGWLRWGWECFNSDGLWRPLRPRRVDPA